jgi:hypothetical protein
VHFVRTCVLLKQFTLFLRQKFIRHWCTIKSLQFTIKFLVLHIPIYVTFCANRIIYAVTLKTILNVQTITFLSLQIFYSMSRNVSDPKSLPSPSAKQENYGALAAAHKESVCNIRPTTDLLPCRMRPHSHHTILHRYSDLTIRKNPYI